MNLGPTIPVLLTVACFGGAGVLGWQAVTGPTETMKVHDNACWKTLNDVRMEVLHQRWREAVMEEPEKFDASTREYVARRETFQWCVETDSMWPGTYRDATEEEYMAHVNRALSPEEVRPFLIYPDPSQQEE